MITLNNIELPGDMRWPNEMDWSPVGQAQTYSIDGTLIIEENGATGGRPITLESIDEGGNPRKLVAPLTRLQVIQLKALEVDFASGPWVLILEDLREFTVRFDFSRGAAVTAVPVKHIVPFVDADLYIATIRMIQV